jgi:hypothetical protein
VPDSVLNNFAGIEPEFYLLTATRAALRDSNAVTLQHELRA